MNSKLSRAYFADLAERVASTFLQVVLSLWIVGNSVVDALDWQEGLGIAAGAAGVALIKGLLANLTNPESGASLLSAPPGPVIENDEAAGRVI
jgi:hypothetical protein